MKNYLPKIKLNIQNLLSSLLLQFFLFQILKMSEFPARKFIQPIKNVIQKIGGFFSFSLGDIIYSYFGIFLLYCCIAILYFYAKKQKTKANSSWIKLLLSLNLFYFLFMFLFGLFYEKPNFPLYEAETQQKLTIEDYKKTTSFLLQQCLKLREEVNQDKKGNFAYSKQAMLQIVQKENNTYSGENLPACLKPSLFSFVLKKIGVAGYYNPFTTEGQYINDLPETSFPFTITHESGHQLGIARENEASFYAFLIGNQTRNKDLEYSIKYKSLMQLLRTVYPKDSIFVNQQLKSFSAKMSKDFQKENAYANKYSKSGSSLFSISNDLYLKMNKQKGIGSYNDVAGMIVNYYKFSANKKNHNL